MFQVVVAKDTVRNLGGLIRQLSLDQFENESRRVYPLNADSSSNGRKNLIRQKSPEGLPKKVSSIYYSGIVLSSCLLNYFRCNFSSSIEF